VTATPAREGTIARSGVAGIAGFVALAALTALLALEPTFLSRLRLAGHDLLQTLAPRSVVESPAIIVDIDEKSLETLGRWPWPRSRLAELVDRIAAMGPVAIAIDILLPEADPVSAEQMLGGLRQAPG
jgi:adenylate cyclase